MGKDTFQCRHMGIPISVNDCLKNYERVNIPGVEARWDEDDPCFSCPQGKEKMSTKKQTEKKVGQIFNPQPSRKLCDEDYVKIVEDLKREYTQGKVLFVPDFVKKSETFAKLSLGAREEFWFKATVQGLVDFLRHNEYEVVFKKITLPNFEDLLVEKKSIKTSISVTIVTEKKPNVAIVKIFPPETPNQVKTQTRSQSEQETRKKTKAEARAKRLVKEARKKALEKATEPVENIKLPTRISMERYRSMLIFLQEREINGQISYSQDPKLIIATGCGHQDKEGATNYKSFLLKIKKYGFVVVGPLENGYLVGNYFPHDRKVYSNIKLFNQNCKIWGYNDLVIKTPSITAP